MKAPSMQLRLGFVLAFCAGAALGQGSPRQPHIGYVYPPGGKLGTTFRVTVGGQSLADNCVAYWSGSGVRATFVQFVKPLTKKQLQDVGKRLASIRDERMGIMMNMEKTDAETPEDVLEPLPNHPLLQNLESKSNAELRRVADVLLDKKKQQNLQIAEMVILDVTIDSSAPPGERELRLKTDSGLTNPIRFEIGRFPEITELEPNDPGTNTAAALAAPVVLNGQILPGDVDRFSLQARKGQSLTFDTQARRLVPFMADAVPGWFQPVVAVFDANHQLLAEEDDREFEPDPLLRFEVPADGEYTFEITDALYRGREDFVYRVLVAPMLPVAPEARAENTARSSELKELEPNDSAASAQQIITSGVVSGSIGSAGDEDIYQVNVAAGTELVAAVTARSMGSPLDALIRIRDGAGKTIALNDDANSANIGLETHHADPYLRVQCDKGGDYFVHISDTTRHGGPSYAYRLRVSPPQPGFALFVTPSSVNVTAGRSAPIALHAVRYDGFDGPIDLTLTDPSNTLALDAPRIPAGKEILRTTVSAAKLAGSEPYIVTIAGHAMIEGKAVIQDAVPAEDMMQAFIYRHLVPSRELMVSVQPSKFKNAVVRLADAGPVKIPANGTATVRVKVPGAMALQDVAFELDTPPPGITLDGVQFEPGHIALQLSADGKTAPAGTADNIIVAAYREPAASGDATKPAVKRRQFLTVLPAIPFEVMAR